MENKSLAKRLRAHKEQALEKGRQGGIQLRKHLKQYPPENPAVRRTALLLADELHSALEGIGDVDHFYLLPDLEYAIDNDNQLSLQLTLSTFVSPAQAGDKRLAIRYLKINLTSNTERESETIPHRPFNETRFVDTLPEHIPIQAFDIIMVAYKLIKVLGNETSVGLEETLYESGQRRVIGQGPGFDLSVEFHPQVAVNFGHALRNYQNSKDTHH